ncbi:MAG: cytochrome b/b6 domain-containing protein [Candidatus Zixiibacteriota bacterium]
MKIWNFIEKVCRHQEEGALISLVYLTTFLLIVFSGASGFAQSVDDCMACHEDPNLTKDIGGENISLYVNVKKFTNSIHADLECVGCHTDLDGLDDFPHDENLEEVNCGECHAEEAELYKWHGRQKHEGEHDIPECKDCHGNHDILPSIEKESRTNPLHLPETCGRCHENLDLVKKHDLVAGKAIARYKNSVHGKATSRGVYLAATCNDCHSAGGSSHRILSPGNQESPINHFNIPKTCGQCHRSVEYDYWEGIHGQLAARGETDSPVCTNCHGEHGIIDPQDQASNVSSSRLAEATCSPCHESAFINEKYDIPAGRLRTWYDSYHGLKSKAGDLTVANCASCHGAHRILPHTDSTSSIYSANLQETCGNCHPGISVEMASTPIHSTPGESRTPLASLIADIYVILIIVTIGIMLIHWAIDLRKQIYLMLQRKQIRRMSFNEVWQHTFLMMSFIVLVITGFALRYSESFWVEWLFGWEGGFPLRGIIHRTSAVIFVITVIWHLIYLTTPRGRQFLRDIWPRMNDVREGFAMVFYNLGIKKHKPAYGRFSYMEKAEYWALVWGTFVMIVSGLFLWFDNFAMQLFPKGLLDILLVVHYYEAWLAMLAIIVWHMYSTIFSPGVYPMNPAWFTGKMPEDVYRHEHAADKDIGE